MWGEGSIEIMKEQVNQMVEEEEEKRRVESGRQEM